MTAPVRIALLGCGAEYSGVMPEIYEAARQVEAEVFYPDVTLAELHHTYSVPLEIDPVDADLDMVSVQTAVKYEGYLTRQEQAVNRARHAERRRALRGVERAEPSRRAGAGVEEPPAGGEAARDELNAFLAGLDQAASRFEDKRGAHHDRLRSRGVEPEVV